MILKYNLIYKKVNLHLVNWLIRTLGMYLFKELFILDNVFDGDKLAAQMRMNSLYDELDKVKI